MATVDEEARIKILDVSGEEIESAVIKALNSATDIAALESEIDSKLNKDDNYFLTPTQITGYDNDAEKYIN